MKAYLLAPCSKEALSGSIAAWLTDHAPAPYAGQRGRRTAVFCRPTDPIDRQAIESVGSVHRMSVQLVNRAFLYRRLDCVVAVVIRRSDEDELVGHLTDPAARANHNLLICCRDEGSIDRLAGSLIPNIEWKRVAIHSKQMELV